MTEPVKKAGRKVNRPIKEDIFVQLESVYRSARRARNYAMALKALEICLKAKQITLKNPPSLLQVQDLTEFELSELIQQLETIDEQE